MRDHHRIIRPVLLSLGGLLALAVSLVVLTTAVSQFAFKRGDPGSASKLNPLWSEPALASAIAAWESGKFDEAERLAARAVSKSPIDSNAVAYLAWFRDHRGRKQNSYELFTAAASLGWRTPLAQTWMADEALKQGYTEAAVLRADALLRQQLYQPEMFELLRRASSSSAGAQAIAQRMAHFPDWRRQLLIGLEGLNSSNQPGHEAILGELKRTEAPPSKEELDSFVSRLVAEMKFQKARRFWRAQQGSTGSVVDPAFEKVARGMQGSPFGWRAHKVLGARLSYGTSGDAKGAVVTADGTASGLLLEQMVALTPGRYALSVSFKDRARGSSKSLEWTVSCAEGAELTTHPTIGGSGGTAETLLRFTVPSTGCDAQWIRLRIAHNGVRRLETQVLKAVIKPELATVGT